jgi:hypothetical protein
MRVVEKTATNRHPARNISIEKLWINKRGEKQWVKSWA